MIDKQMIIKTDRVESSDNLTRLFSELKGSAYSPDVERINKLIASGRLMLYLIVENGLPVGMTSVVPCRTATSDKLWIEDVCVLSECRGRGYGRLLMEHIINDARQEFKEATFWLTSRPSRTAARELYRSLGFKEHETGVFYL